MKFINYLKSISGVDIYPLFALLLFVVFFAGITWYVFTTDKKTIEEKSNLPFE